MPLKFQYIKNRADFFRVLDELIVETESKMASEPWGILNSFLNELLAMKKTTQNGRKPTFEER